MSDIKELAGKIIEGGTTGLIAIAVLLSAAVAIYLKYKSKFKGINIERSKKRAVNIQAENAAENVTLENEHTQTEKDVDRLLIRINKKRKKP